MQFQKWFSQHVMLPLATKQDIAALKSFALTMSIAFVLVFMGLLPWLFNTAILFWPLYLAIGLCSLYVLAPKCLYYPYLVWMLIASILGFINTRIVLALAYYLLIVPIGLVMQAIKGLQYQRKSKAASMWVAREKAPQKDNLKEPF